MKKRVITEYLADEPRINKLVELFGIPHEIAKDALKEVGLHSDKLIEYLRRRTSLKNSGLQYCKRCHRPLKSVQSILDGYGSTCLEKIKKSREFRKNNLVGCRNETKRGAK